MPDDGPPPKARRLEPLLELLHGAAIAVLMCLIWLVPDDRIDWRWWCTAAAGIGCAVALGRLVATRRSAEMLDRRTLVALAPYGCYIVALLASYWAHPSAAGWREVGHQAVFLAVIACVATVPRAPLMLGLMLALLTAIGLQVLGPSSVESGLGRAIHYRTVQQWSGYPEIGLLLSLGAAGCLALLFASRSLALGGAAALLAAGFAGDTVYILSRASIAVIVVALLWLALVATIRFRTRVALGVLATLLVGGIAGAAKLGQNGWERVTAATNLESGGGLDARRQGWRAAWGMLRDHPFVGVGPGRYPAEYPRYSTLADSAHAYNLPLHVGAELGVVGLVAYAAIWARLLVQTLRHAGRTTIGLTAFAAHGILLAFLLRSQSEHFLANLPASFRMLLALGVLFGLAEAACRVDRPPEQGRIYA